MPLENQKSSRMFEEMLRAAWARVTRHRGEDIAAGSGALFDREKNAFTLTSLNRDIEISAAQAAFSPELEGWHKLVILHYLDLADGAAVSSELMPFGSLKDGLIRGTKFDHDTERALADLFSDKTPDQIARACAHLGAEFTDGQADLCAVFHVLPRYPVWLKVWFADDEFETSGNLFVSRSANHYLTVEDAVTVGSLLLSELARAFDR